MIAFDAVTFTYPNAAQPALCDVTLRIETGEFVLITGPSGCGKSTLLRCINGLVPHFSGGVIAGSVYVAGVDVVETGSPGIGQSGIGQSGIGQSEIGNTVGFVFQTPEAQAVLDTVEPEIAFALENAGVPAPEMLERVASALDLLDLTPLRDRPLRKLSGGERQRVAIASALVLQPSVLVLDEPTSQLDPQSAESLLDALVHLNKQLGLTIILAEHRLERVLGYADRLLVMGAGEISADGPVRDVIAQTTVRPPLITLADALQWHPLPLSVEAARPFAAQISCPDTVALVSVGQQEQSPILEIERLYAGYAAKEVLHGVSLRIASGEIVGLMGHNGSGKSTLLKTIIGLLPVRQGVIVALNRPIAGRAVADICRDIGYLPQNPDDLLFADSVRDELLVTLRNHGLEDAPPVAPDHLLRELGLSAVQDAYPRDLSVGQRQRVALAAIMVTRPQILLLDEPTRGLDAPAKQALAVLLRKWAEAGMAIILATHDVELAASLVDRVVLLADGTFSAVGNSADVLTANPAFTPQIARLFPGAGWLTVADALDGIMIRPKSTPE